MSYMVIYFLSCCEAFTSSWSSKRGNLGLVSSITQLIMPSMSVCVETRNHRFWFTEKGAKCWSNRAGQAASLGEYGWQHFGSGPFSQKRVTTQNVAYPCSPEMLLDPLSYSSNLPVIIKATIVIAMWSYFKLKYPGDTIINLATPRFYNKHH